jgi:3-oxoacyl-[acyl-carrier-protein] synthase II
VRRRRVVVTGVGAVTPLGVGAQILIDRWAAGESGIEDGCGRCAEFDPHPTLTKKEVRRSDRYTQLAIGATHEAMEQAGWLSGLPYEPHRIGCVLGTGIGGIGTIELEHDTLRDEGERAVSALAVPMMMGNAAPGAIAMRYAITGPNWAVVSACAAGTHAIGTAARLVQSGEVDAIVTGGAEAPLTTLATVAFARMGATSRNGVSCPFDARRDGFVIGEGAGVLLLEEAEAAKARGAPQLAEVLGYGATADAYHLTAPEPGGRGMAAALSRCLADAGVRPAELHYVNAHGTSTPLNDRVETEAIKRALGEHAGRVPVSSLKSAIGHLLGAGGAVEAVATVLALRKRLAPPTLNYEQPDPELDLDYVPDGARSLPGRDEAERLVGVSNSFGFGGQNAVLCVAAS